MSYCECTVAIHWFLVKKVLTPVNSLDEILAYIVWAV